MKKQILAAALVIGIAATGGVAFGRGGGGGVPSPFGETSNRKVELADGEMYTLYGKVVFDNNDVAWFWVDLSKHPWLANQHRQQNPYYRLLGPKEQWREYDERAIELTCFAQASVVGGTYDIGLSAVTAGARAIVRIR